MYVEFGAPSLALYVDDDTTASGTRSRCKSRRVNQYVRATAHEMSDGRPSAPQSRHYGTVGSRIRARHSTLYLPETTFIVEIKESSGTAGRESKQRRAAGARAELEGGEHTRAYFTVCITIATICTNRGQR